MSKSYSKAGNVNVKNGAVPTRSSIRPLRRLFIKSVGPASFPEGICNALIRCQVPAQNSSQTRNESKHYRDDPD